MSPILNLKVAIFPVVMVGESAGISSTVCGGYEDMLRPRLSAWRDGSTLDRTACDMRQLLFDETLQDRK